MNLTQEESRTVHDARRLYSPKLRRGEVLELCALFGHTTSFARNLIEGPDAPIKGKSYGSSTRMVKGQRVPCHRRAYFDREHVIAACL